MYKYYDPKYLEMMILRHIIRRVFAAYRLCISETKVTIQKPSTYPQLITDPKSFPFPFLSRAPTSLFLFLHCPINSRTSCVICRTADGPTSILTRSAVVTSNTRTVTVTVWRGRGCSWGLIQGAGRWAPPVRMSTGDVDAN